MASSALATAFVNIVPGTQAVEAYLKGELPAQAAVAGTAGGDGMSKGMATGFGAKMKGYFAPVLAGMAASFAAVGIKNFLGDSIKGASDFNEQGAAVNQVFGSASGAIQKFASSSAKSLGQSKTQVLEAAKQFGIYGKAAGLAGQDNADFSGNLVKLATDLASFNNTSVDDAIMALGAGLRGENEPLRRYGVLLDDATLKAKAMAMGIYDGKGPLDQQAKVMAANAVIMEQTTTQQGDFERTSGGLANQQRILTAQVDNLKIGIGTGLLPVMTGLATFANNVLLPALGALGGFFRDFGAPIAAFAATVGVLTVALNLQAIATAITSSAVWGWTAALLANPITWIVIGIGLLIAGIVLLAQNWDKVTKFLGTAWNGFVGWIGKSLSGVGDFFNKTFKGIGDFIGKIFGGLVGIVKAPMNAIIGLINSAIGGINALKITVPDWVPLIGGQTWGFNIPKIPKLAKGGFVTSPTTALIGEAGPEVVTPLKDFERMMKLDQPKAVSDRPIYADGIGLLGWLREEAQGQARLVFNTELSKATAGIR